MVETLLPSKPLAPYVLRYRYRVCEPGASVQSFITPARLTQFVELYLEDRYQVEEISTGSRFWAESASLVGLQAVSPIRLNRTGRLRNFTIVFRPTAFHRLFRLPMHELAGKSVDLEAVCLAGLRERVGACRSFAEGVAVAEEALLPFVTAADAKRCHLTRWIQVASETPNSGQSLDQWLNDAPVGPRQVQRLFQKQLGVSPKRFWRVRRFETALRMQRQQPFRTWGDIAAELGYHDQMHLVHDFRDLASAAPTLILDKLSDSY
jgi:AraC-like DNA-binding protein